MNQLATIHIEDLRIPAIIGTKSWEQKEAQEIILTLTIQYNAAKAIEKDDIHDALDYENLTKSIIVLVTNSHFQLMETLANKILQLIMNNPLVLKASIRIDKPKAIAQTKSTAVELTAVQ